MAEDAATRRSLLSRRDLAGLPEARISHPFNPNSDVRLKRLSPLFGLERLALYIARVPPGKESFVYHRHERDEEFLVIISGRGLAEIGDDVIPVGAGDIMAFPAPHGPPHHLSNPHDEDLVYLMGGESSGLDVAHFPRSGKHLVLSTSGIWSFGDDTSDALSAADWSPDPTDPPDGT